MQAGGIASFLEETAHESLIALLWDDLVGVENALNSLQLLEGKMRSRVLMMKLDAILAKVVFVGYDVAGLKECQFRRVVDMR